MINNSSNGILQEDLEYIANSSLNFNKLKNKSILITGATGLVGSLLVKSLIYSNDKNALNLTILPLVRNKEKAEQIFGKLLEKECVELITGDINSKLSILQKVDFIIHGAAVTTSKIMISKPVEVVLTALNGTINLLELAKEKKVESMVYLSSMEMYGSFDNNLVVEEKDLGYINPLEVRSNYPESKRMCENICIDYLSEYDIPVKIARLAQTFGAGILPGENRVFAQFARSVINKENIVLHTAGKSEGNYCYTRDCVVGVLTILLEGSNGEAYNICNEDTHTTIGNMAKMVADKVANGEITVIYDIPTENTFGYAKDTRMKLSSNKLRNLGWKPSVGLEEAYIRLIQSIKESEEN